MTVGTVPTARELRPYQIEAVAAVHSEWATETRRTAVVAATGLGKSTIAAEIAVDAYRKGLRVAMIAHRGELLNQMLDAVRAVDPTVPESALGIVKAEQDDHTAPIVAASFQTLAHAHRLHALGERQVLIVDEAHHAGAEGFHATLSDLGGYDGAFMVGLTATLNRDKNQKGYGLGEVFQSIAFERDIVWAIDNNYLVKPRGLTVRIEGLNRLNDIRSVAGDFHQGQLAEVMEAATEYVVDAVAEHAADRHAIVFAASVDAAFMLAAALPNAEAIVGTTSDADRAAIFDRFRSGVTRYLVTVQVLTEGVDLPMCDAVVLARPTRSVNLYTQMVGRGLRLWPGKTDALVLDLSGSTRTMRLVQLPQLVKGVKLQEEVDGELRDLTDAEVEELTPAPPKPKRQGPVNMVSIDLINGDDTLWLETTGGVPFFDASKANDIVFLWPHQYTDTWAVGYINTRFYKSMRGWANEGEFLPISEAIEAAEEFAVERGWTLPNSNAPWRRGNTAPSDNQLKFARRLGIPDAGDMTKGRVADEISVMLASKVLPTPAKWIGRQA